MKVPPLTVSFDEDCSDPFRVVVDFKFGSGLTKKVYFETEDTPLHRSGNVLFCLGLLPAVELGADLIITRPVDPQLLGNAEKIQSQIISWNPNCKAVSIHAETAREDYPSKRGRGLFFSGGIDSSYSLATEIDQLDTLVTIIGANGAKPQSPSSKRLRNIANAVSAHYALDPIIVETNIREVSDRLIGWSEYHGALLAGVRHMLAHQIEEQLIAASGDETSFSRPWGSHPLLDPLFATQGARTVHHGLIARAAKFERLLGEAIVMQNLQVCDGSEVGSCGICNKCTFVLYALDIFQTFDASPTYRRQDLGKGKITISGPSSHSDWISLQEAAVNKNRQQQMVTAIDKAAFRHRVKWYVWKKLQIYTMLKVFKRFKRQRRYLAASRS